MAVDVEGYYTQFGPMVLRRCRHLLKDEEAAVDAMQDTFVQLLRYADRLDDEAPSSLLYRMATNVCLNKLRSAGRKHEDADTDLLQKIACAEVPEERFIAANLMNKLFAKHRESTRTIAVLHLLDRMTLQEVADEVGMSVSGVRKRLRPLKSQLAELQRSNLE
ncbi:MAG: sigma-70 family RNA polymerase sigma factor [Deltaproteobacteria bacterium]|nr:sigma-70 family RNA polymerase sigma factor [Deltaproteobacteria bacterium]MBN2674621.1 sigma-70 family RNA polymerase sigma factor [Deltaproteobacteria bacterium]